MTASPPPPPSTTTSSTTSTTTTASAARALRLVGTVMALLATTSVLAVVGALGQVGLLGPPWWALPLLALFGAAYAAAVVSAVRGSPPEVPAAALLATGAVVLLTAPLLPVAGLSGTAGLSAHATGWPWHTAVAAITGCAVLLRHQPVGRGTAALAAVGLGAAVLRALPPTSVPAAGGQVLDAAFLVALGVAVFASTRGVEDVSARLRAARAAAARTQEEVEELARAEAERSLWEAAVHDDVLSALRSAESAETASEQAAAAAAARAALAQLATDPAVLTASAAEVRRRAEAAVLRAAPGAAVDLTAGPGALPGRVADAVVDALVELVRNARRHNGPGVAVRVEGSLEPRSVRVRVEDDGRGFDPAAVSPARLGLRVSVEGRMRAVGGTARVRSAPGRGVRAELRWQR